MKSKNVQREKCRSGPPHTIQKDGLVGGLLDVAFITRMANGKTCFGDSHTRPPESESHWVWFLGPSVVIDAEGMQNIEQGGEEGEELEKDRGC